MKHWWQSRTVWISAVEVLGGIIGLVFDGLESGLGWLAIGAGIVMLILRKITSESIGK